FVAYDLDEVFEKFNSTEVQNSVSVDSLSIPEDEFLHSQEFQDYLEFKKKLEEFSVKMNSFKFISEEEIDSFIKLNPEFWNTYFVVGEYYFGQKNYKKALENYKIALQKEITTVSDKELIQKRIKKSERKIK